MDLGLWAPHACSRTAYPSPLPPQVCVTCHNGIHAECFGMWVRTKGSAAVTCPLCRSAWPEAATSSGRVGAEGFVNLAREAGVSSYRPSYSGWPNRRFWDEY